MKCPHCGKESSGTKWCENCGMQLTDFANSQNSNNLNYDERNAYDDSAPFDDNEQYYENEEFDEYEDFDEYDDREPGSNRGLKITLAVIAPLAVIAITVAILIFTGVISFGDPKPQNADEKKSASNSSSAEILENEEVNTLIKNGQYYMSIGDYDSAETVYKTIIDKNTEHEEAAVVYEILYNYNRALKKLESKKYEDARILFDKIPPEYTDYEISEDVDKLDDEIIRYEVANATFENLKTFIEDGDYESALEVVDLIDEAYLSSEDVKALDRYRDEIADATEEDDKSEKSDGTTLSESEAEKLIENYVHAYIKAVNENDFMNVAPYLSGKFYEDQERVVEWYAENGDTEEFNYFNFHELRKTASKQWEADVTESIIVYHSDGTQDTSVKNWTYTIEYIGAKFYLTNIEATPDSSLDE
ncbi:MAG: hypothetical protein IJB70_01400 [Clostridia bacterium]|nr:hypothetical protein [Clostridia bacterium]